MSDRPPLRRRSPWWVRQLSSREVHAIALRLASEEQLADLSASQEWLWECLVSELEWRARQIRNPLARCSCALCWNPWHDGEF